MSGQPGANAQPSASRNTSIRAAFVLAAVLSLVLTAGFFAQVSWATMLWPWPAAPLSFVFIASILAAIAIPVLWIGVSGEIAAAQAGSIDLAVMYGGMLVYVLTLLGDPGQPELWPYVIVFGVACAGSLVAFAWSRRIVWRDQRPMPGLVRGSFAAFAIILVAAGTALIFHSAIFSWQLTAESSMMFGLVYLGAAVYFIHGFLRPRWHNAAGQLAGFLAYDLVLLAPFLNHFKGGAGEPDHLHDLPGLQRRPRHLLPVPSRQNADHNQLVPTAVARARCHLRPQRSARDIRVPRKW